MPNTWEPSQIDQFNSEDRSTVFQELDDLEEIFTNVKTQCEDSLVLQRLSRKEFMWAWNTLKTRSFFIKWISNDFKMPLWDTNVNHKKFNFKCQMNKCLVPYIDMVNHNSEWSNADVEMNWIQRCEDSNKDNVDSLVPCWTLYATKPIKEKQQIFINYDPDPTNKLLINFGFVDEFSTNLDEKITFTASEIHKNPIRYVRLEAFTKNLSQEAKEYYFFIGSKGCSWELQKAVLTTIVEYPQEFSGCMTFEDIFDLKFMKIPSKLKEKANKTLKEIILNKIKTIQQYLYELEENNGFLIQSNKMVMAMFKVQIRFLEKFVENNEQFLFIRDRLDMECF